MKRIINIFFISIFCLLLQTSCSDGVLDPNPLSFYAPENVYVDETGYRSLLTTMRQDVKREFYERHHWMFLQYIASDLAVPGNEPDWINLTPSGYTYPILPMFEDVYQHIKNTNVLISRIDDIEWDNEQTRNEILSEALFYRSYWYYRLVHSFGDVPWIGEEVLGAKLDFYTHSRWTIIDKIQSDMEYAVDWLPETASIGYVTKYAGLHLLTKIYLANTEFEKAIESATDVIDGPNALMTERFGSSASDEDRNVLWDLHRVENKNIPSNTETIFTTVDRFDAPGHARSQGTFTARHYVPHWWSFPDETGARGFDWGDAMGDTLGIGDLHGVYNHFHSHGLWRELGYDWEATPDLRRADINWIEMEELRYTVPTSPNFGEPISIDYLSSVADTSFLLRSFPFYKTFMPPENGKPNGQPQGGNGDWYVFRLAGTYLLRAEAYYWLDQPGLAAADINKVRQRANAELIESADVTIDYIFHERARELFTEEPRHNELVRVANIKARLNIDGYSLNNFHERNWYYDRVMEFNNWYQEPRYTIRGGAPARIFPHNVFWPIPESVITANTMGQINQNKGYNGAEDNVPPLETIED